MNTFEMEALEKFPDEGPVTMLNLIRFRDDSLDGNGTGRDGYKRYTAVASRLVEAVGGRVLWVGKVQHAALHEGGDAAWDRALLVTYPSRAAFLDMVRNPEFQRANLDRQNGVEKHVILATKTVFDA